MTSTPTRQRIQAPNISAVEAVLQQAKYFPAQEALIYGEETWDYGRMVQEVRRYVAAFKAQGVTTGDRVVYLGLNSVNFLEIMLASWWLKAVFVPLNFRLAPREVESLLERSVPKLTVVEPGHVDLLEKIPTIEALSTESRFVVIDNDGLAPLQEKVNERYTPLTDFLAAGAAEDVPAPAVATQDDLAILMFTSGTTGQPKGVQLTHGNVWWNSVNVDSMVDTRRGDTNLASAPLFHIGGLNALTIRVLTRGGRTVIHRTFDPRKALADIEKYQANQAFMVAAMLAAMQQTDDFEMRDLSSMRAMICAGAPVPPVVVEQYKQKNMPVQQAWGLTETAPFATYLPTEFTYSKTGSCGVPMPYTEVKIVDPASGETVTTPKETGEMWVRGPNVAVGYWHDDETTAAAFQDGWFRSGDIGYADEEGFFYIVDRLKDMIITGGENVYPAEVERALAGYPNMTDVAVVGAEDPEWGQSVVAVVSMAEGVTVTVDEIREYASAHLARYKLPKKVILLEDVPRNGAGKLDKGVIRGMVSNLVAKEV